MVTTDQIKTRAYELGFELCGVAPAKAFPELRFLASWLDSGYAGEMHYMARTADARKDVRTVLPTARTVIALGTVYNVDRPYSIQNDDPNSAEVSRYAWGCDYHTVIGDRTKALLKWMKEKNDEPFDAKTYVDTGPVQERVYAQHAGLGWIGKNTCLINPDLGSWLFLSEIICSLPLETDSPSFDQCGTCSLCLEACPTQAIVEPWVLDASRCVSYLTIELKGEIPEPLREPIGSNVYGCDICQEVCPWNETAEHSIDKVWQPAKIFDQPKLTELWKQTDDSLQSVIKSNAMSRAGLKGLRRNIAVALGNSQTAEAGEVLSESVSDDSRSDQVVDKHVTWARLKLQQKDQK